MNLTLCANDPTVQRLVVNSTLPSVQELILETELVKSIVQNATAKLNYYVDQYEAQIALLYYIEAQVGGASIIIGMAWPAVLLGVVVSVWRIITKPSFRAALLLAVMGLTVADVTVITWARSSDLRDIYIENSFLYGKLLVTFSIARNALLLIASCLRYRVVFKNTTHQHLLVIAGTVIAISSTAASYRLGFDSLNESNATSVSNAFWTCAAINPIVTAVLGFATFTLKLRANRFPTAVAQSDSARHGDRFMRNLELINSGLMATTIFLATTVVATVYADTYGPFSYYPAPLEVTACAYWGVGENLFEVVALFKTEAEEAIVVVARKPPPSSEKQATPKADPVAAGNVGRSGRVLDDDEDLA
ncbi:hypothetical protein HDU86_001526 [Geranomyces michiganensis]|nr:hypothetical protein HDU86_001526 [Geranomyces michiganensis]